MGTRHGREEDELHHHVGQTVYTTVHFTAFYSPHCTVAVSASTATHAPAHAVPPQAGTAAAGDAGNAKPSPKDTVTGCASVVRAAALVHCPHCNQVGCCTGEGENGKRTGVGG